MNKENVKDFYIVAIGLIIWILYLCANEIARYSFYTVYSFNMFEILSMAFVVSFIITFLWLIVIVINIVRGKDFISHRYLFFTMLALFFLQCIYTYGQLQIQTNDIITSVKKVDTYKSEIFIETDKNELTLDVPDLIQDLIKSDGTEYLITYEYKKVDPSHGRLCTIKTVN